MPLSLFCDALPYSEMSVQYKDWFDKLQLAPLMPNIAYSSSLHWQLYCNKYPDEWGILVDWVREPEKNKAVRILSTILRPLDVNETLGWFSRKVLDRIVFRRNMFANVPYQFRKDFTEKARYLFWDYSTYSQEELFKKYTVVSQDEGHLSFETTMDQLNRTIEKGDINIFGVLGFADSMGHQCRRGEEYSRKLKRYMEVLKKSITRYMILHPHEPVLIVSDHGMSTINNSVDLHLEQRFGKQSKKTYIAYSDSAIMCVWAERKDLLADIEAYLKTIEFGHLLTDEERRYYCASDRKFGDLLFILREGNVFATNWFGKSRRKQQTDGAGMHGFWPENTAKDQIASIVLINGKIKLKNYYDYHSAYHIIYSIICGETE